MTALGLLTLGHTLISIVALLLGVPAIYRLYGANLARAWTDWFLYFAVATSVTGFFFPFNGVTPAIIVGIVALVVLVIVFATRQTAVHSGVARWLYVGGIVLSEFFLAFVTIAQSFGKIPVLHALAPTQQEPPFAIAQGVDLLLFVVIGILAVRKSGRAGVAFA